MSVSCTHRAIPRDIAGRNGPLSHPTTLYIDSSVRLAEHIARRISAEVRSIRSAEQKAKKRGGEVGAQRHN
jgi:hypothetical protein